MLYVFYIVSAFCFPVVIQLVHNQAPLLLFVGSIGYTFLPALSLTGESAALIIAGIITGSMGLFWSSHQLTVSSLAIYISERDLLSQIQEGKHLEEKDGADAAHPIYHIGDISKQSHIDWYLSTIVDKNNRIISPNLTPRQTEVFRDISSQNIGLFSSLSWLSIQLASVIGSLIAFGSFHITLKGDVPGIYTAETGSVQIFYGIMTFMNVLGCIAFFVAMRLAPKRVFYKPNTKSKWGYYKDQNKIGGGLTQAQQDQAIAEVASQDCEDGVVITNVLNSAHPLPGRAKNDKLDDNGEYIRANPMQTLLNCIKITVKCARDPALAILLIPFLTAYCPLSFTISAFSSRGGIKTILGVKFVPIFILIVAVADVITAFVAKGFITSARRARIACIAGLILQLLGIVIMYVFPYYSDWDGKADAWKFGAIIGVIEGVGDALGVSGISALVSILCRVNSSVLSGASSLLMCGRGIGLFIMFLLTSQTNFRDHHWPVVCGLVSASILCHILSLVLNIGPNVAKIIGEDPTAAAKERENKAQDKELSPPSTPRGDVLESRNSTPNDSPAQSQNSAMSPTANEQNTSIELQSLNE